MFELDDVLATSVFLNDTLDSVDEVVKSSPIDLIFLSIVLPILLPIFLSISTNVCLFLIGLADLGLSTRIGLGRLLCIALLIKGAHKLARFSNIGGGDIVCIERISTEIVSDCNMLVSFQIFGKDKSLLNLTLNSLFVLVLTT